VGLPHDVVASALAGADTPATAPGSVVVAAQPEVPARPKPVVSARPLSPAAAIIGMAGAPIRSTANLADRPKWLSVAELNRRREAALRLTDANSRLRSELAGQPRSRWVFGACSATSRRCWARPAERMRNAIRSSDPSARD